jgi:hypothetical protein
VLRSFSQATTANEWPNEMAFVGLSTCMGVNLLSRIMGHISMLPFASANVGLRLPSSRTLRVCLLVPVCLWSAVALTFEGRAAWQRTVLQFDQGTQFRDRLRVPGMEGVYWGEPTQIDATTTLQKADFEGLVSYLRAKRGRFFVMGDSTMLYGILGAKSPQPLLYFLPSHSFLEKEIPSIDQMVLASLEGNKVSIAVREKVTFLLRGPEVYARLPRTWAWFTASFDHVSDFGNYEVWERKSDGYP